MRIKIILIFAFCSLLFISCSELIVPVGTSTESISDFDSTWSTAKQVYPFFKFKKINWDSIYSIYKPKALSAKGDEINAVICDMLSELRDAHVGFILQSGLSIPVYYWSRLNDQKSFSQAVVNKYIGKPFKIAGNGNMSYEIFNNIGYVYISTFSEDNWVGDFDNILQYMKNTDGIIIDERNNGGGSTLNADYIISRFTTKALSQTKYFTDGSAYWGSLSPRGPFTYSNPVVVLTNGACYSTADYFPDMMSRISSVTLVGDTTGGGGGIPQDYPLPSGKQIHIPSAYFLRTDGQMIEWNGIVPKHFVLQTEADKLNGIDKQLEKAISIIQQ